jgi:hypothetical protein
LIRSWKNLISLATGGTSANSLPSIFFGLREVFEELKIVPPTFENTRIRITDNEKKMAFLFMVGLLFQTKMIESPWR